MNVVDSSAWLEYFAAGPNGPDFQPAIKAASLLLVPTIVIYEVSKKLLVDFDPDIAVEKTTHMRQGQIVDLNSHLAIEAARISKEYRLPMADAIIYATAKQYNATVWTMDDHFQNLSHVKYFPKK